MRNIVVRAGKTFIQAALGYICTVSLIDIDWKNKTVVAGVILAAISAGISALMNVDWEGLTARNDEEEGEA